MAAGSGGDDAIKRMSEKLSSNGDTSSTNSIVTRRSEPSSNAPAAVISENIHKEVMCKRLSSIRKSIAENVASFPHLWNDVLVMWSVIATLLDPLFCYILVVDQEKNCIGFDKKLRLTVVVLRSLLDFGYILIVFPFRSGETASDDTNNGRFFTIARRYIFCYFTADILAVLPLPQVMSLLVISATKGSQFAMAIRSLKFVLVIQCLPRAIRVFVFLKKVRWSSGIFPDSAWAKSIFNLFLYMLASHVFGAFWYLFSVERKVTCLQVRCHSHPYCHRNYNNSSIERLCMDGCSGKASSNELAAFNFGIFGDAFNSGIVYSSDFIWKFSYCFWWGLQNLSSLGQGLKTSGYIWEIYFAVSLTIFGLVLFALLIGNLQTILQATIARQEEMRLKREDIKLWLTYQKLPDNLRERIKQYEKYKWQKTRGIDIANILHNLPKDLRRDTVRYLCFNAIKSVPMFQNMDEKFLDAIFSCLKPILYIEHSFIVREGEPLEEMIFIIHGKLWIYSNHNRTPMSLEEDEYFGEDLLKCAFKVPLLSTIAPISTKTISARTKVEAFVLSAKDLNSVVSRFRWLISQELRKDPNYKQLRNDPNYEEQWAPWAALVLQTAWRRYTCIKKKCEKEKSQLSSAIESGNSQPSGATNIHASTFIARALRALKHRRKRRKGSKHSSNNADLAEHSNV